MNTDFQRKGNLWNSQQQSRLIESMLLRFPMPAFFFDAENDERWLVVDGLQRLWTFKNYLVDESFGLTGLEILIEFSDKNVTFSKLSRTMQRRILETQITTYIIQPGTPKDVKYNVFRRINTGGLVLNSMEIRNALNQGTASQFLERLSENRRFTRIVPVRNRRMEDRELILRALSFVVTPPHDYFKPLSRFLDVAMEKVGRLDLNELSIIEHNFLDSIELSRALFGRHIFSRSIAQRSNVRLNSALFEVWIAVLSKLTSSERALLFDRRDALISRYKLLFANEVFERSIVTSTSGKAAVSYRFLYIEDLIKSILND